MAADSGVVLPRRGFHEDIAAIVIGVALVTLALTALAGFLVRRARR